MVPGTAAEPRATVADTAIALAALAVLAATEIPVESIGCIGAADHTFVQAWLHVPALVLGAIAALRVVVGPVRPPATVPTAHLRAGAVRRLRCWVAEQRAVAAAVLTPALAVAHTAIASVVHLVAFLFAAAILFGIAGDHPPPASARTFAEALAAAGYLTMSAAVLWRGMTAPGGARSS
jgi:hypothetical protein